MPARVAVIGFLSCLAVVAPGSTASGGDDPPKLTKTQRATLEAVVAAVDANAAAAASSSAVPPTWQSHVLRASDGSHYVAVKAHVAGVPHSMGPVVLYVRLASRRPASAGVTAVERSAVMEWLKGQRGDPLPMRAARSTTVNAGEMPVGGTASAVGDVGADATTALRLVALQQEREKRLRDEAEARRKDDLERTDRRRQSPIFPFEDFDAGARLGRGTLGLEVMRSITAGPGDYDLYVGWAETPARSGTPVQSHVISHRLTLPAASAEFQLSDVVVAAAVVPLSTPYAPAQQAAHPYAFGVLDVVPAIGNRLSADGTVGLIYQVVNPSGTAAGKPDVEVGFQVFRLVAERETPFARLETQRHGENNLPGDFDVAKGHPLFGAVRAPLTTFPRGAYRIEVTAVDRLAGRRVTTDARFEVLGTPATLLREAPALGQPFRREAVLAPDTLSALTSRLAPSAPSEGLSRLLAAAAQGRFAALIQNETIPPGEQAAALALRAIGLYGLGDSPRAVGALLQQAVTQGAPAAPLGILGGAVAALGGDDRAAIVEWTAARGAGLADAGTAAAMMDALLRQGRAGEATALAQAAYASAPSDLNVIRGLAAVHLAAGRYREAIDTLDRRPDSAAADLDADFLVVHALFAGSVSKDAAVSRLADRERFQRMVSAYVAAGGRHASLVEAWRLATASSAAQP